LKLAPLAAVLALTALAGGAGRSVAASTAGAVGYRILLTSNRDGRMRGYSIRPDGSRLTPLLPPDRALVPTAVSRDGGTIAYGAADPLHGSGVYVSRADGSGLHQVVPKPASAEALSPDGKLVAFTRKVAGIWIVGTDGRGVRRLTRRDDAWLSWAPAGKAVAFVRSVGEFAQVLVVRRLDGKGRVVARGELDSRPQWSPGGRWIAYVLIRDEKPNELWVVRPNGARRHRVVVGAETFDWSPDGTRLAVAVDYGQAVAVVGLDGRGRRFGFTRVPVSGLGWLPGGRRLALAGSYGQIWTVGRDGHGLRRVTREGANVLVGWTPLAPVRRPAAPLPKTERVVGRRTLALRAPITSIAADGSRVAFGTGSTTIDCGHVAVWTPAAGTVARQLPLPCGGELPDVLDRVALAGTRVAWRTETCCGHTRDDWVATANVPRLDPPWSHVAEATLSLDAGWGTWAGDPVGDGTLLAFAVQLHCDSHSDPGEFDACPPGYETGDVSSTTLWRLGGHGRCPGEYAAQGCTAVAKVEGKLDLLAVDAGRIVVGRTNGVAILSAAGRVLRDFAVTASAAALSGRRLAVQTAAGVEVYDTDSGARLFQLRGLRRLQDLESGILVTASGSVVTLHRLADGRTATFRVTGKARAQLEPPGLFVAGDRRITFTPLRELFR
jgi:Tol biopolymer transport system component